MVEHLSVEIELVFEAEWLLSGRGALGARHGRVLIVTAEQKNLVISCSYNVTSYNKCFINISVYLHEWIVVFEYRSIDSFFSYPRSLNCAVSLVT